MYYTGVGSRATPTTILQLMQQIAGALMRAGYILRSGGAEGADSAFALGAELNSEIFYANQATTEAMAIAAQFHPNWAACSPFVRRLHGRNAFQVLGIHLNDQSEFLICWTSDECVRHSERNRATGGTGTAISIASSYGVPVHNLANTRSCHNWQRWLEQV